MRCEKCGNDDKELFVYKNGVIKCRKCLSFKIREESKDYTHGDGEYNLSYNLTSDQQKASEFLLDNIKNKKDCVLNAVTGSGKTEIIYESIKYSVKNNLKIAITIPRKDVVIELYNRIKNDFKSSSVVSVYGGKTNDLYGDIVILTTHQLFRYNKYFDLVIIDEVDAFPFNGNKMLETFLYRSMKGSVIYMSATIPENIKCKNTYYLNKRYHGEKLDVPKVKYFFHFLEIKRFIKRHVNDMVLIYFPTIKEQILFSRKFKLPHYVVNSKIDNRNDILDKLHKMRKGIVLTTLVLERGITFKNCHVIVYKADHSLFGYENLVQISGRVGRKKDFPHGEILFLIDKKTKSISKAIKMIKRANE